MKILTSITRNWKTTTLGVASLLIALGSTGGALKLLAAGDIQGAFSSLTASKTLWIAAITGLGLIFSRDADKSSEQSGVKDANKPNTSAGSSS